MKKLFAAITAALLLSLCACSGTEPAARKVGEAFTAGDYRLEVLGAYVAAPAVPDEEYDVYVVRMRIVNPGEERLNLDPASLFGLKVGNATGEQVNVSFLPAKGYLQAGAEKEGQVVFRVPKSAQGELSFTAADSRITFEEQLAQIEAGAPIPQYAIGDCVRIDQLEYTVTGVEAADAPEGAQPGEYLTVKLSVQSVSAGAPTLITQKQFRCFGPSFEEYDVVACTLPASLETGASAQGTVTVRTASAEGLTLGLSRHIGGQDYMGIQLKSKQ